MTVSVIQQRDGGLIQGSESTDINNQIELRIIQKLVSMTD